MNIIKGRDKEAKLIRQANRAAAMGRLMLGEFKSWQDFLMADMIELEKLPRRRLKSGNADVRSRLTSEIRSFCSKNFLGMDEVKLSRLYEEVKASRGLEMPLLEFEESFASINPKALYGCPKHLTVCISLWGLQFRFPEDEISRDVLQGLSIAKTALDELTQYEAKPHSQLADAKGRISELIQVRNFSVRAVIMNCFNLMEAYLNGISWDYTKECNISDLSETKKKLLKDTQGTLFRDKLIKYPKEITGNELWDDTDLEIDKFLKTVKPFRDSLVHPSPFPAPEKHGGYDKLQKFYDLDFDKALDTACLLASLLKRIHYHIKDKVGELPRWLMGFDDAILKMDKSRSKK